MRLGILGGSFNPIHHGHLILAERAAEALELDMPTAVTPLKNPADLAPARDRLAMVRAALRGNRILEGSDFECRRKGVSYTVDTLRALARPGDELFLIVGSDTLTQLSKWKEPREVARLCTFGVATRAFAPPKRRASAAQAGAAPAARVPKYIVYRRVPIPLVEISGTEIRERVRRGRSIRYLVPDAVADYIRRKRLYR